ncbi:MAG TPA: DsbA family protein [Acidimicrobiales bacterium]|nr:DsbA family protein [Acidimicrobiales bacterium]
MKVSFTVTWDYRCPFARNAVEHILTGLEAGAPWDVRFAPFSLSQVHVRESEADVWDDPTMRDTLLAMQAGIAVRDSIPDAFPRVHGALFAARHDEGRDLRDAAVVRAVLQEQEVDPDAVFAEIDGGGPLEAFRREHEQLVAEHSVFGVPTFVADGRAVFVRLMSRPQGDADLACQTIDRVLHLVAGWPDLNEFKHTTIPR